MANFLESLEQCGTATNTIVAMGPALQFVHKTNFLPGECAAASEHFKMLVAGIKRSVDLSVNNKPP